MKPSDLFGAFENPTRPRVLDLVLAEREICVCDPCDVLGRDRERLAGLEARLRCL